MWRRMWDLAGYSILDAKVLDCSCHLADVSTRTLRDTSTRCEDTWLPLVVVDTDKASWQADDRRRVWKIVVIEEDQDGDPGLHTSP